MEQYMANGNPNVRPLVLERQFKSGSKLEDSLAGGGGVALARMIMRAVLMVLYNPYALLVPPAPAAAEAGSAGSGSA